MRKIVTLDPVSPAALKAIRDQYAEPYSPRAGNAQNNVWSNHQTGRPQWGLPPACDMVIRWRITYARIKNNSAFDACKIIFLRSFEENKETAFLHCR